MDEFYKAIDQTAEWFGNLIHQSYETVVKDIQDASAEVEDSLNFYLEPVLEWLDEIEDLIEDTSRPFVQTVTPALQDHPACIGCSHYHGETYGGYLLVCGMHPYGVEDSSCPDWESVWNHPSR